MCHAPEAGADYAALTAATQIAAGLFLVLAYVRGRVRRSQAWPLVPGAITAGAARSKRNRGATAYYYPVVSYQYAVAGRPFTGNRIAFAPASLRAPITTGLPYRTYFSDEQLDRPHLGLAYAPLAPPAGASRAGHHLAALRSLA